ncbi:helix-turn-helix domain-containing protein [Shewanella sp. MBTL60-007]|uniref:helix-turn-helix domain-containing protein n=1 Tax=Shewanella sp. MBTL60-007 TaxID=2815911 RepID=UPI00217F3661|nr:helix-turn-helix transcriptional regulator [Shewanella sp. MBTL60-007]
MSISLNIIGQRIVTKRKIVKLSQVQLADRVGISDRTLSKIENGYDLKLSLLLAICDALNIETAELLSENNSNASSLSDESRLQIDSHLNAIRKLLAD